MIRHLDLFSGIGGFALAARWCGWETIGFCEIDPWCQRVLAKNFPGAPIHDDIKTLTVDIVRDWGGADVLTGGFPCQPYSRAGRRRGSDDDRALWPEMRRVIDETQPRWVLGENVTGIIKMELDLVLSDLEARDYTCWPVVIPAVSVEAPHRRDRLWVIAHANSDGEHWFAVNGSSGQRVVGSAPPDRDDRLRCEPESSVQAGRDTIECRHWRSSELPVPGVDDGVPRRVDRIRGLGNAIVPQVAYEIMRHIT